MNLILVDENDLASAAVENSATNSAAESMRVTPTQANFRLTDRRARHICEIHRAKVGDRLRVSLINGLIGSGEITSLVHDSSQGKFEVELNCEFNTAPPPAPDIELWIALPRPKFLSKVVETATTFGIKRILFFNSYRVDKVYWSCDQITPRSLRESMLLGLEQAGDTVLPTLQFEKLFKPFIEDRAKAKVQGREALIAHPIGQTACPYKVTKPTTVAIGPEGGFIPYEIEKFQNAGFVCVDLFPRILKVETAVAAILGRLI